MPARNIVQRTLVAAAMLAATIMAACSASQPPAPPPVATQPIAATATLAPSPLPSATATLSADASPAIIRPEGMPDVPYDMTGLELIAHNVRQATYSGYACIVSPEGCSCELPTIQEATFTFTEAGPMNYAFESDDSSSVWEMTRAAPDQWEYSFGIQSEERDDQIGEGRVMISFTEEGFVYTQFINFYESGLVLCPEVPFRRLMSTDE